MRSETLFLIIDFVLTIWDKISKWWLKKLERVNKSDFKINIHFSPVFRDLYWSTFIFLENEIYFSSVDGIQVNSPFTFESCLINKCKSYPWRLWNMTGRSQHKKTGVQPFLFLPLLLSFSSLFLFSLSLFFSS